MQGGYIGDHWEDGCQVFVGKKSGDLSFLVKLWNAYTLVLLAQKVLLEDSYDLCSCLVAAELTTQARGPESSWPKNGKSH